MEKGFFWVSPQHLDAFWPEAKGLIQSALNASRINDTSPDQVQLLIRQGRLHLLAWGDTSVIGVAVVDLIDYPKKRVAHVLALAGSGVTGRESFECLKNWCRDQGASEIQGWCDELRARLYRRYGLTEVCKVVRAKL